VILVLPGSRHSEIGHLTPVFGETVAGIHASLPGARFVLPALPRLRRTIEAAVARWPVRTEIVDSEQQKLAAFRSARAALAASGTVTLELALAQVPTVAAYRAAGWEAAIARRLIRVPTVILPNLILGRNAVPEFLQERATGDAMARAMLEIVPDGPARAMQLAAFAELEALMQAAGGDPAAKAVDAALSLVRDPGG
jgi:lipid-A-disaccharide synthase